jgi:hypothetical protein
MAPSCLLRRMRAVGVSECGPQPGRFVRRRPHTPRPRPRSTASEGRDRDRHAEQHVGQRLDRVARDGESGGALEALAAVAQVADAGRAAAVVDLDVADHRVVAHLDAVGKRVGQGHLLDVVGHDDRGHAALRTVSPATECSSFAGSGVCVATGQCRVRATPSA